MILLIGSFDSPLSKFDFLKSMFVTVLRLNYYFLCLLVMVTVFGIYIVIDIILLIIPVLFVHDCLC